MCCLLVPGCKTLILRKTLASLGASALALWREHVAKEIIANGTCWFYGGSRQEPAQFKFANGSSLTIGGLDKPSKIMSTDFDLIYVCEATELTLDDWEMMTSRLRSGNLRFQQLIADANPAAETHWLYQRCLAGTTTLLRSVHADNPVLIDETGQETEEGARYLGKLRRLSGVRRARLLDGRWVAAEGIIYEEWTESGPAANLVDRFYVPRDWPRFLVIDFGFRNPFVAQWWAQGPDGQVVMYREIYHTGRRVEEHCTRILELHRKANEPWFTAIICDHDREDRAQVEHHLGSPTIAARKGVLVGINLVKARLVAGETGKPGLVIMRDSTDERDPELYPAKPAATVEEFGGYVWLPPTGDRAAKEEPLKENDHGADCARYLCAYLDWPVSGEPEVVAVVRPPARR
jgi:phage terminase large subunit